MGVCECVCENEKAKGSETHRERKVAIICKCIELKNYQKKTL